MKIKNYSIGICAFVCFFLASNAWAETTLNIDAAVAMALERNLSLRRAEIDIAAAQRRQNNSWNPLLPSLSVGALVNHPAAITDPLNPQQPAGWTPGFALSASLHLTPAIIANMRQTKEEYEAGLINYMTARQELELQVRKLFYQILLLRANIELAEHNVESAQSRHEQASTLMRAGRASTIDEIAARLDVSIQQTTVHHTMTIYNTALDHLKYFLMIPMEETVILEGDLLDFTLTDPQTMIESGQESLQMRLIRQSIAVIEAQRRTAHHRSFSPVLTFSWDSVPLYIGDVNTGQPAPAPPTIPVNGLRDSSGQFSIIFSIKPDNFLRWSPAKEQINTIDDAIAKQRNLLSEASINHQNTVERLLRDIARSGEIIETLNLNITLAEETLRMQTNAFRQGAVELTTLNNTRDNLFSAQNRLLSEKFNLLSIILDLEKELNIPFGSIAASGD